jgi:hypothetical protein
MTIEIQNPELEELIRQRMATGGFQNVEEALLVALRPANAATQTHSSKQRLGQFLLESPLRNSGLKLKRQKDYPRPIDL